MFFRFLDAVCAVALGAVIVLAIVGVSCMTCSVAFESPEIWRYGIVSFLYMGLACGVHMALRGVLMLYHKYGKMHNW